MVKRLHYFHLNGLAESTRYILHYGEVDFEDVRYPFKDWPKIKSTTPFGQLPVFEVDDKGTLHQSMAIAKYFAQSLNLVAGDPFKDAQLDAIVLTIMDFWDKTGLVYRKPSVQEKAAALKVYLAETLVYYFSRFEKQLEDNGGFFNGKLSWADFVFVGVIEAGNFMLEVDTKLETNYPRMQALIKHIHSYPRIKKYVAERPPMENPFKL